MARDRKPPTCRDCRGPIVWAHDTAGKAIPLDGTGLSDDARLEEPRFDPDTHRRHVCSTGWLDALREHAIGKRVTVEHGTTQTHGILLAVERDHIVIDDSGDAIVPAAHVHRVRMARSLPPGTDTSF